MNSLTIKNIKKSYGKKHAVKDVSINIKRGEVIGLLGPNGAGKTTTFYMIVGMIPADSGEIFIDDTNITKFPMYIRGKLGIGYLPQEKSIFRGMSVEDNIYSVLEIVEKDKKKRKETLESLLEEFGISHLAKSSALALSGGERRRVEIARALASNPSFLLLDEPFAGIDPIAVSDIINTISYLKKRNIGILITDHNVRETLSVVDRAYIIYDGKVLIEGSSKDIVKNKTVKSLYLGEKFDSAYAD